MRVASAPLTVDEFKVVNVLSGLQVAFLLAVELAAFPLMCGAWLDLCTLRMLGATLHDRAALLKTSPLACVVLHW